MEEREERSSNAVLRSISVFLQQWVPTEVQQKLTWVLCTVCTVSQMTRSVDFRSESKCILYSRVPNHIHEGLVWLQVFDLNKQNFT